MRRTIPLLIIACGIIISCSRQSNPQSEIPDAPLQDIISSQDYSFKATSAIPARGRTMQLTSDYFLVVKKDSLVADLPYFGRAYTAPIGQTDGGIRFTSTDFSYSKKEKKNGSYEIEIIPRDFRDVQRLFLTVSKSGYGNLYVNSQNRQAISFNGYVEKRRR